MSLLPILGTGGPTAQPTPSEPAADTSEPPANTTESQDTAPPAPSTEGGETNTDSGSKPSDPQTEPARVALVASTVDGSSERSAVEAAIAATPDQIENDARRFAEAAQQQQRLEMLIEAVNTPVAQTALTAPAAEQQQVGTAETDGTPV